MPLLMSCTPNTKKIEKNEVQTETSWRHNKKPKSLMMKYFIIFSLVEVQNENSIANKLVILKKKAT